MQGLKIVLIGYGKMGHVIEEIAQARGHQIVLTIDRGKEALFDDPRFASSDVAIEFTAPAPNCHLSMDETHHIHKLDAPSGTAITLAEAILSERPELKGWELSEEPHTGLLPITAHREGEVPGIHTVTYTSEVDRIVLKHEAFGRQGFALGAVLAAEFAHTHQGWLTMDDMLQLG